MKRDKRRQPYVVIYAGFVLALALLMLAGVVTWRSQRLYQDSVSWTNHSYEVLNGASGLLIAVQRAEGSARAYAIGGDGFFLTDARTNLLSIAPRLATLDSLIADNPTQIANLDSLRPMLRVRAAAIDSLLLARVHEGKPGPEVTGIVAKTATIVSPVRAAVDKIVREERRLLAERVEAANMRGQITLYTVGAALLLALLIIGAAISVTMRELADRTAAEEALQVEAERQAVIIEMQQAIATAGSGDPNLLDLLVAQAMQLTGAGGAALSFVEGDHHRVRVARGDLVSWQGTVNPLANSLFGEVISRREPESIPDVMTDPRTDKAAAARLGTRSCAILPILTGDSAAGALVISSKEADVFTPQDIASLKILSGILSAGMTNLAAAEANDRLLTELRASRDAAEEANRAKSAFLATMSHELRTPLNSVIGFANILRRNREGKLGEKDLQFLDRIKDNGTHLLHLINDVLDVSKIEAGRMEVRPVPTELGPLIQETLAQLEPQVRDRPVKLEAKVPAHLTPLEIDPARFTQVLLNLLSNALKFTEQGSVRVEVTADLQGHPSRIDVIDTGIGIPDDRLHAIFEAFTQAEATTERRFGGTGLGLTISRALLKLMGADLNVASTVGTGSTFTITLPKPDYPATPEAVVQAVNLRTPPPLATVTAPLILVVDDEADSRSLLRHYLEEDGYRTAEASDGAEGIAKARELRPALITLDLRMPVVSGVDALRQLRSDPELAEIPVVVVSIEAAEQRGSLIGAVEALAKPVEREALLGVIRRIRPTSRRLVLVVDDDPHTRHLYTTILGQEGYQTRVAADGLDALQQLQQDTPDLILLDLMMPVMDGGTFLAALRADQRFRDLPVAVITALDADSDTVRRLEGVAQAVLQKGAALEQSLTHLIDHLVGPARK